jgi:hypothetical protein
LHVCASQKIRHSEKIAKSTIELVPKSTIFSNLYHHEHTHR